MHACRPALPNMPRQQQTRCRPFDPILICHVAPVVPSSWRMLTHASRKRISENLEPTTTASRATKYLRLDWPPCPSPPLHDGSTCVVRNALVCQLNDGNRFLRCGRWSRAPTNFELPTILHAQHRTGCVGFSHLKSQAREHGASLAWPRAKCIDHIAQCCSSFVLLLSANRLGYKQLSTMLLDCMQC